MGNMELGVQVPAASAVEETAPVVDTTEPVILAVIQDSTGINV